MIRFGQLRHMVWMSCLGLGLGAAPYGEALANSRDLRAMTVPAAACLESARSGNVGAAEGGFQVEEGYWFLKGISGQQRTLVLRCPLPLTRLATTGAGANAMTQFRVHLANPGTNPAAVLNFFIFVQTKIGRRGSYDTDRICSATMPLFNTGAKFIPVTCNHTFVADSQYWFAISLNLLEPVETRFFGLDFP